MHTQINYNTK